MYYRCKISFKSLGGKTYKNGDMIDFDEYYRLAESERKYFVFRQLLSIKKENTDRIR